MDVLPNLEQRFHQMWNILLRPPGSFDDRVFSQESEDPPIHVLNAISLLISQHKPHGYTDPTKRDVSIRFKRLSYANPIFANPTLGSMMNKLAQGSNSQLLLITSNISTPADPAIIGAYFPCPPSCSKESQDARANATSHFLFQLQPSFHLLRWTDPSTPMSDLVTEKEYGGIPSEIVAEEDQAPFSGYNGWCMIGDSSQGGACIQIDPEAKSATLKGIPYDVNDNHKGGYQSACNRSKESWETVAENARIDIFTVLGVVDPGVSIRKSVVPYTQDLSTPRIGGEELATRIQGFGSDG
ncbi:hypothetical protein MMC25_006794 [Agyrium rufum]|nr:hypothetical protein [Agyrium rufum]